MFLKNHQKIHRSFFCREDPPGKRTRQNSKHGSKEQGWHAQLLWARHLSSLAPRRELGEGQRPRCFPSTQNPTRYFSKKILCPIAAPSSIYQFGQPFANSFGGITHRYVTPPPIQLVFDMMLYILWRMLFLVSYILLEKFQDLQDLGWNNWLFCLVEPLWVFLSWYNLIHLTF